MDQDIIDIREMVRGLVDTVGELQANLADTTLDDQTIQSIADQVTSRVTLAINSRFADLEQLILETRGFGTSVVPTSRPLQSPKPSLAGATFTALNSYDRDTTFAVQDEASKEVLERIITGLRGEFDKESKDAVVEEILDKAAELKFSTHPKFLREVEAVADEVYKTPTRNGGRRLSLRGPRHARSDDTPKPPRPSAGSSPWGDR